MTDLLDGLHGRCPDCSGPVRSYRVDDKAWSQCLYCPWISPGGAEIEKEGKFTIYPGDFDDLV